jgi:hypothetical protein
MDMEELEDWKSELQQVLKKINSMQTKHDYFIDRCPGKA